MNVSSNENSALLWINLWKSFEINGRIRNGRRESQIFDRQIFFHLANSRVANSRLVERVQPTRCFFRI